MATTARARYTDDERVLFIADLHLDPARPAMIRALRDFCSGPAGTASAVYILGDLFEAWIGDDDDEPAWAEVIRALADLSARGIALYFMPGNRDFLIGERFLGTCSMHALPDHEVIALGQRRVLLCHGDTLCSDDHAYQAFRCQVRDPAWQRDFLARPLAQRRSLATGLRGDSGSAMADKSDAEMDVNADAVRTVCRTHGVDGLIHGHTHRPGHDVWDVDGRRVDRWVLADWFDRASMLRATGDTLEPVDLGLPRA